MFKKILIANRGEIACRIIRTAKRLGIHCVAIYSDIDANALHVKQADEAYCVGPAPAKESYLNIPAILQIAKQTKVAAIHPGYGFLAENPEFAEQCEKENICFIGPSAKAIAVMGSKSAAKKIMEAAKVPIIPGYHGSIETLAAFEKAAEKIGYPILLKPVAGGGGKGMRLVTNKKDLATALAAAKREAKSSFGDEHILLEKYFPACRHIEVQIFGDSQGNYVYLFERDCSIQRRHQKIIEEAPALHITTAMREKLGQTAVAAAQAINYVNAGTVEFLFDNNNFYFMEMNTRLQVEHPITEMITQLDLVEWQFKIACGESLPLKQDQLQIHGHSIEARIYAEDPAKDFLPATGQIIYLQEPPQNKHVRIDSGIEQNDTVSAFYDPLLAKLVVWDNDRAAAIRQLQRALEKYQLAGVKTNIDFLKRIVANHDFQIGNINTQFIEKRLSRLITPTKIPDEIVAIATLYLLLAQYKDAKLTAQFSQDAYSPWFQHDNWRLDHQEPQLFNFNIDHQQQIQVKAFPEEQGYQLQIHQQNFYVKGTFDDQGNLQAYLNDIAIEATIVRHNSTLHIFNHEHHTLQIQESRASDTESTLPNQLTAPMPGTLVAVLVSPQQKVAKGETLAIIEAMKMEHTLIAPANGIVKNIYYKVGDLVNEGVKLFEFEITPQSH